MWLIVSRIVALPPIAGLAYEVIRLAGAHGHNPLVRAVLAPGLWLQRLTTREPTLDQVAVSIRALQRVLELEEERTSPAPSASRSWPEAGARGRRRLRAVQAPLKQQYRDDPTPRSSRSRRSGDIGEGIACSVDTGRALAEAGLHPATGGDGLAAVLGRHAAGGARRLRRRDAHGGRDLDRRRRPRRQVRAEGDLDFRGTLGVDKEAPVGFRDIRLCFELDTDADAEELATLLRLTERYCVVLQTLRGGAAGVGGAHVAVDPDLERQALDPLDHDTWH